MLPTRDHSGAGGRLLWFAPGMDQSRVLSRLAYAGLAFLSILWWYVAGTGTAPVQTTGVPQRRRPRDERAFARLVLDSGSLRRHRRALAWRHWLTLCRASVPCCRCWHSRPSACRPSVSFPASWACCSILPSLLRDRSPSSCSSGSAHPGTFWILVQSVGLRPATAGSAV